MGRIQSPVGLITGIPIDDTVKQLLAISARPRDLVVARTAKLQAQQVAITDLTAQIIGVELAVKELGGADLFATRTVSSSDETVLAASVTGSPAVGAFRFTPVRQAQAHQLLSAGFLRPDRRLGAGEMTLGFGGFVDPGIQLDELNGGAGVQRGKIRIVDRSGTSGTIDLRFAMTMDDVVEAINSNGQVRVTASLVGDRLRLVDRTGQTVSNLKVEQSGAGSTAADLGLGNVDVASAEVLGDDILSLYEDLALGRLNDGNGVTLRDGVADLRITFHDGSTPLDIDFNGVSKDRTQSTATTSAANGVNAQVKFTSVGTGEDYDGYRVVFIDDNAVVAGQETVAVDAVTKRITFRIDAGNTRALHVLQALNRDSTASQYFTASLVSGGNGSGLVTVSDTATTSGGAATYRDEQTLGDVLATINAADPARLHAQIAASGDGLELIDLTAGGGTFSVSSLFGGTVAEDLGLAQTAVNGVIQGKRRLAGLNTVLLDSLAGGHGLGTLGALSLTNRNGTSANVDLSTADTLADVIDRINAAGIQVTAGVNDARNGIELSDTSGGVGYLVVANGDATNTADKLRISLNESVPSINSGSLHRQTFHEQLTLASLRGGQGVGGGSFLITDSQGRAGAVNLSVSGAQTVGDVLDLINGLNIGVEATINDTGDGILLADTAGGLDTLTVTDVGNGTAARNLRIAGTAVTVDRNGNPTQVIDGTTTLRIKLDDDDTLQDLADKINAENGGIAASLFYTGSGTSPYRLALVSQTTGSAGEMLVDAHTLGISLQEVVAAKDALMLTGTGDASIGGALTSSSSNDFDHLIEGVRLTVNNASSTEVTVQVRQTDDAIVKQLDLFVEQYNKLRGKLDELTYFNENDKTTGALFGSAEALRIDVDLAQVVTSRYFGAGPIRSLEELGLSLDDQGKLRFDKTEFHAAYTRDPQAVEQFFTQGDWGVAAKLTRVTQQLAGEGNSVLLNRIDALQWTIDANQRRTADLNAMLERQSELLYKEFYNLETVIGKLQNSMTALSNIQPLAPLVSTRK